MKGKGKRGFTLVELMIALAIVGIVLSAVTTFFLGVLRASRVQARVTGSNIEGVMGLQILRKDLSMAGYGLPWGGITAYSEAASGALNDSPTNPPRAVASLNSPGTTPNGSDYLAVKAVPVTLEAASRKWTHLRTGGVVRTWDDNSSVLADTDRVIVQDPGTTGPTFRTLVTGGGTFFKTYAQVKAGEFASTIPGVIRLVYGVTDGTDLRMPFNRADYFIGNLEVPRRCAPGTGVLEKGIVSHVDGTLDPVLPLIDCVRDFQVSYRYSTSPTDPTGTLTDDIDSVGTTAEQVRENLREVRLHILAHEGAEDDSYTHNQTSIYVGDPGLGQANDVSALRHYRWKVYTLVVAPESMGNRP
jgi:prepilin-type N-terminal cleavage/methylation domain-containing protein